MGLWFQCLQRDNDSNICIAFRTKLKDVNLTYEFFDGYQEILISRKVAEVIKKNVPDAEFYPVFKDTTYIK